jgi:PKD repeat protein
VPVDRRLPVVQMLLAWLRRAACAVAAGGLMVGCGGGDLVLPRDGAAAAVEVVDGDEQTGSVGQPLSDPVVVEVRDAAGAAVEGATVQFVFTSAGDGAQVAPDTAETDTLGRAEAYVVLGSKIGLQTGEVRVLSEGADPPRDTFSAVAFAKDDHAPVAGFGWGCDALVCRFSDTSTDDDSDVTGWSWRFGDGGTSTEREPTHRYDEPGSYTVTLTVTDDKGASDDASEQVMAAASPPPASNAPPQADFELDCDNLRCTFTDRSGDPDGEVVRWQWSFGDGATSSERSPSHTYTAAGRYDVRLVVTDDDGADDDRTRTAEPNAPAPPPPPPAPNDPPSAEFEVECQELRCVFVDRSADPDGSVVRWQWSFGDGASSSERNPSHSYQASGRYDVLLVVTDNDGAADSKTHSAEPKAPEANKPPRAEFEMHCDHLTCSFEDKSSDEDGMIVSRQWSFGDGARSGEQNPTHPYAERGKYEVQLTVTDDDGASVTKSHRADVKK